MSKEVIRVGLVDDHILLRTALASLIDGFDNCKIVLQASTGEELISELKKGPKPDVLLLDLNMPVMDGYDTARWLQGNAPDVHVLMLTMYDTELALIRLLQAGVKGFLKKDIHPAELKYALQSVMQSGYYYSYNTTGKLMNLFRRSSDVSILQKTVLNEQEIKFLKLACTEMTYKEIAMTMNLNPRAVDNVRDILFSKLEIRTRVGLAMYAIRHGIATF